LTRRGGVSPERTSTSSNVRHDALRSGTSVTAAHSFARYHAAVKTFRRGRLPLPGNAGISRGPVLTVLLDGKPVTAFPGESVAAVLVAEEGLATRTTVGGARRGVFCGMGVCYDCLVVIDDVPNTRACMTQVANGMRIDRQVGLTTSK